MVESCNFDGGDCIEYMEKYPMCNVTDPWRVGDGNCDFGEYMTYECGWDGGDCIDEQFPECKANATYKALFGNGVCDLRNPSDEIENFELYWWQVGNLECGYDGFDCEEYYGPVRGPSGAPTNSF